MLPYVAKYVNENVSVSHVTLSPTYLWNPLTGSRRAAGEASGRVLLIRRGTMGQ